MQRVKPRLAELLVCPWCGGPFEVVSFGHCKQTNEVAEGLLRCPCGRIYPIVDTIPRVLDDAFTLFPEFSRRYADRLAHVPLTTKTVGTARAAGMNANTIRRTRESFGYQWTLFSEMVIDFRENFLYYIQPLNESFFPGKVGLDIGCGFGRHIYNAAEFGAEMVGVDVSIAIDASRRNTQHLANVHLVQADLYHLPFREGSFDFVYSIGVLHHLPDPEAGFQCLIPLLKHGGAVFIWVYSKSRPVVNLLIEHTRAITKQLPARAQKAISLGAALVDWAGFIVPYRIASALPILGFLVREMAFPRLKLYSSYPFQVVWADWFDRLAAPVRFYYDWQELDGWLDRAKLNRKLIGATGLFGWRVYGERP